MTLEIFIESGKIPTFNILLIITVRGAKIAYFTCFINLFDILATPELVFGFRLSIILLTLSTVTD